jgi:hypothetical protein
VYGRAIERVERRNQILIMDKQSQMFAVNNNFVCFIGDKWMNSMECAVARSEKVGGKIAS